MLEYAKCSDGTGTERDVCTVKRDSVHEYVVVHVKVNGDSSLLVIHCSEDGPGSGDRACWTCMVCVENDLKSIEDCTCCSDVTGTKRQFTKVKTLRFYVGDMAPPVRGKTKAYLALPVVGLVWRGRVGVGGRWFCIRCSGCSGRFPWYLGSGWLIGVGWCLVG